MRSVALRPPPTGEQHEIRRGSARAIVSEVGATLRSFSLDDADVIDGFAVDEYASAGRGQVLAPWPNRLEDGSYTFAGREGRAAIDEPERRNAIHGLVRWLPWRMGSRTESSVELSCVLYPQPAYPWTVEVRLRYRIASGGLVVDGTAINRSDAPAPFGIGFHPYLTVGTPYVDDVRLTIPARRSLLADDRGLPTGEEDVSGTALDFTKGRTVGDARLDVAFTAIGSGSDGLSRVQLHRPDGDRRVTLWMDDAFGFLMVYTGDDLQPLGRRRRAIAIEPMTCPPNAFRSQAGSIGLDPGASWEGHWGITAEGS